ncbi:MAG TPA: YDG/SRA domain-containing protein [Propionibacteriaceae bacterium]
MSYIRTFGEIPGHPEGTIYRTRNELRVAGIHAHNVAGISGTPHEGADAIVLNGGYSDDQDEGDIIIYTGHGGQNQRKEQIEDQRYEKGNAALVLSQLESLPVRVIRGYKEPSPYAPIEGYRYDGLYRVVRHWFKLRRDGFRVLQFRMVKIVDVRDIQQFDDIESDGWIPTLPPVAGPSSRTESTVRRIARKARVVRNLKTWYENRCQICNEAIDLPSGPASQVAHIQGLGTPHNGPDDETNALCLCPNDHLRFDNGALYLTDELQIVNTITNATMGELHIRSPHTINLQYVRQHRSYWCNNTQYHPITTQAN